MSVWMCRAGRYGEYESRFLEDSRIFYTFEEFVLPLSSFDSRKELQKYILSIVPGIKEKAAINYAGQGWTFLKNMAVGDWVVTPSKTAPGVLHFAEITGEYTFDANAEESYRHSRSVKWFADIMRSQFEQDIQFALGASMTICKIKQEDRIKKCVLSYINLAGRTASTPPPRRNICSGFGAGVTRQYIRLPYKELQGSRPRSYC